MVSLRLALHYYIFHAPLADFDLRWWGGVYVITAFKYSRFGGSLHTTTTPVLETHIGAGQPGEIERKRRSLFGVLQNQRCFTCFNYPLCTVI